MNTVLHGYDELMKRYLDVCNQALSRNKNRFPFKQILGAARAAESGKVIEVTIIDRDDKAVYAMSINADCITAKPHGACNDCACERTWCVDKVYLEHVTQNPEEYIVNPAKINWEWMYDVRPRY